jgi:hypothetical protein
VWALAAALAVIVAATWLVASEIHAREQAVEKAERITGLEAGDRVLSAWADEAEPDPHDVDRMLTVSPAEKMQGLRTAARQNLQGARIAWRNIVIAQRGHPPDLILVAPRACVVERRPQFELHLPGDYRDHWNLSVVIHRHQDGKDEVVAEIPVPAGQLAAGGTVCVWPDVPLAAIAPDSEPYTWKINAEARSPTAKPRNAPDWSTAEFWVVSTEIRDAMVGPQVTADPHAGLCRAMALALANFAQDALIQLDVIAPRPEYASLYWHLRTLAYARLSRGAEAKDCRRKALVQSLTERDATPSAISPAHESRNKR